MARFLLFGLFSVSAVGSRINLHRVEAGTKCSEVIVNATKRTRARFGVGDIGENVCKCPANSVIVGEAPDCEPLRGQRYFPKTLKPLECRCELPSTSETTTTIVEEMLVIETWKSTTSSPTELEEALVVASTTTTSIAKELEEFPLVQNLESAVVNGAALPEMGAVATQEYAMLVRLFQTHQDALRRGDEDSTAVVVEVIEELTSLTSSSGRKSLTLVEAAPFMILLSKWQLEARLQSFDLHLSSQDERDKLRAYVECSSDSAVDPVCALLDRLQARLPEENLEDTKFDRVSVLHRVLEVREQN